MYNLMILVTKYKRHSER